MGILGVQLFRWLPLRIFQLMPCTEYVSYSYLGKVLPATMFIMLVVYCYKNIDLTTGHRGIPDFIAGIVVLITAFLAKNMFLSIAVSGFTFCI